jgi:hypothetical protein
MSEAELREHARALRATRDGSFAGAAATRQRILVAAHRRKRGRRAFLVACTSLATLLVLSTAWAELTGALPRVISFVMATPRLVHHEGSSGLAHVRSAPAGPETAAAAPGSAGAPTAPPVAVQPVPAIDPAPQPSTESVVPVREPAARRQRLALPTPADARAAAEESAYEAAHRAHFTGRDPAKALLAWDAYLSAYPDGRFSLEARYNRALSLVRLGSTDEARAALEPFADGRYGTYRRTEASDLLSALAGR